MTTGGIGTAILAALLIAGCGSSPSRQSAAVPAVSTPTQTATPSPGMTHGELARALNASCSVGKARQDSLSRQFDSALERGALPEAGLVYVRMLAMMKSHIERVGDMEPSAEDRGAFRRYLTSQRRILGLGARLAEAMREDDGAQVARLSEPFNKERDRRLTAAVDLGADKCGS